VHFLNKVALAGSAIYAFGIGKVELVDFRSYQQL
jgi:hypothetical protein